MLWKTRDLNKLGEVVTQSDIRGQERLLHMNNSHSRQSLPAAIIKAKLISDFSTTAIDFVWNGNISSMTFMTDNERDNLDTVGGRGYFGRKDMNA